MRQIFLLFLFFILLQCDLSAQVRPESRLYVSFSGQEKTLVLQLCGEVYPCAAHTGGNGYSLDIQYFEQGVGWSNANAILRLRDEGATAWLPTSDKINDYRFRLRNPAGKEMDLYLRKLPGPFLRVKTDHIPFTTGQFKIDARDFYDPERKGKEAIEALLLQGIRSISIPTDNMEIYRVTEQEDEK